MGSDILHNGKYILWTNRLWCPEFLWQELINYRGHAGVDTFYKVGDLKLWVWNLVVDILGGKEAESVWEHGVKENIWT